MKEKINNAVESCAKLLSILQDIRDEIEERNVKTVKIKLKSCFDKSIDKDDIDEDIEKFRKDLEEMLNDFTEKRES